MRLGAWEGLGCQFTALGLGLRVPEAVRKCQEKANTISLDVDAQACQASSTCTTEFIMQGRV